MASEAIQATDAILTLCTSGVGTCLGVWVSEIIKSNVTKNNISAITKTVEEVKKEINKSSLMANRKYELKYNACLNLLGILDAHISHYMKVNNDGKPSEPIKQYVTAAYARSCHTEMLLTVDNQEIMLLFLDMMHGRSKNIIMDLDKIRGLIRHELGFGRNILKHDELTWLGTLICTQEPR